MHRAAVVLCDLHGKTRTQAAAELNRPEGTVAAWLARGRKALAARLARRGVALPAAGLVAVAAPSVVAAELASSAVATVLGRSANAAVLALAEGVMRGLSSGASKLGAVLVAGALLIAIAAVATAAAWRSGDEPKPSTVAKEDADPKPAPTAPAKPAPSAWREKSALELTGWLGGSAVFSADGSMLFVGGTSGHVRAYEVATLKQFTWEHEGGDHFAAVALAPDGKTVALTTKDGVQFLDSATGKIGDELEEKGSAPTAIAFFPDEPIVRDGQLLATKRQVIFGNGRGYFVKTWLKWPNVSTIQTSTYPAGKEPADPFAMPLAVSPDGKRAVVTGPINRDTDKNVLWAWSAGSGAGNKLLEGHKAAVVSAAWSKEGKLIVTGDADGTVIIWDAETFKEKARGTLGGRIVALVISADGKHTAAAVVRPARGFGEQGYAEEVFVWPTANPPEKPEPISTHQSGGPFKGAAALAFAPDGKSLVSTFANFDSHLTKLGLLVGKVRVFAARCGEARTGREVRE